MPRMKSGRVVDYASDPTFSSVEDLKKCFSNDIDIRKQTCKHLCHICDYGTNKNFTFKRHLSSHGVGERFKCDQCELDFPRRESLKSHILAIHQPKKEHPCDQCDKIYVSHTALKSHIRRNHIVKRFKCDECPAMFGEEGRLTFHKKSVHMLKALKCLHCSVKFNCKRKLAVHIQGLHGGKIFCCDICDHKTSNSSSLRIHKQRVHQKKKNWFCKKCSYSCYAKCELKNHMRLHTGEKPRLKHV